MPTRKVLQSLPYTIFTYKIPSPQEGTVCPSLPRDIRMKGMILYRFWMGFLLFLPAYVYSPGGIIIFGSKREGGHWINHMTRSHVTSPHVPTEVTPNQESQSRPTGPHAGWSAHSYSTMENKVASLRTAHIFTLSRIMSQVVEQRTCTEPQEAVAFRAIPSV